MPLGTTRGLESRCEAASSVSPALSARAHPRVRAQMWAASGALEPSVHLG